MAWSDVVPPMLRALGLAETEVVVTSATETRAVKSASAFTEHQGPGNKVIACGCGSQRGLRNSQIQKCRAAFVPLVMSWKTAAYVAGVWARLYSVGLIFPAVHTSAPLGSAPKRTKVSLPMFLRRLSDSRLWCGMCR